VLQHRDRWGRLPQRLWQNLLQPQHVPTDGGTDVSDRVTYFGTDVADHSSYRADHGPDRATPDTVSDLWRLEHQARWVVRRGPRPRRVLQLGPSHELRRHLLPRHLRADCGPVADAVCKPNHRSDGVANLVPDRSTNYVTLVRAEREPNVGPVAASVLCSALSAWRRLHRAAARRAERRGRLWRGRLWRQPCAVPLLQLPASDQWAALRDHCGPNQVPNGPNRCAFEVANHTADPASIKIPNAAADRISVDVIADCVSNQQRSNSDPDPPSNCRSDGEPNRVAYGFANDEPPDNLADNVPPHYVSDRISD